MPKGYWVAIYHSVSDADALARYAAAAGPVLQAAGGRFLARGVAARTFEQGEVQRCVVMEFDSVEQAIATYESAPYQAALALMQGAVRREVRIVPGV
jgi:uncharacterized protein (DUF1330 family)